ncbi:MAG: response regulator [Planctomycetes bacterium]|nr:response regulator [Planctomycetota bacterium]
MSLAVRRTSAKSEKLLVVDDESFIREAIELYFATEGFQVLVAANATEALVILEREQIDIAILDIVMPGMNGVELLREIKRRYPDVEVLMASGNGTLQTAVEAMRLGAYDYVTKPILNFEEDLLKIVRKALERRRLLFANRALARDLQEINCDLKNANGQLRRRVAELELLCETGRMIGEVEAVEPLFDLVADMLRLQLEVPRGLLIARNGAGWRLVRAPGYAAEVPSDCEFTAEELGVDLALLGEVAIVQPAQAPALPRLALKLGGGEESSGPFTLVPLRAGSEVHGFLVVPGDATAAQRDLSMLLRVFATQIAPPLALLKDKVAR